jgi:tetratricopeptide (TPR) repeat protein
VNQQTWQARLGAVETLLDQGSADSAVRMLRSAWEPDLPARQRVPLYALWIRALCESEDLPHAITLARRACEEFPAELALLAALGNALDLAGELDEAYAVFSKGLALDPEDALACFNIATVLDRRGATDDAEAYYRRCLELEDDVQVRAEAVMALGGLLRRTGRVADAHATYDSYLEAEPLDAAILVEDGICLSDLGEFDAALQRLRHALAIDPRHANALYNLAVTYQRQGASDLAIATMTDALHAEPEAPLTAAVLGAWYLARDPTDKERALPLLHGAVDRLFAHDGAAPDDLFPGIVVEEVFDALWHAGYNGEARALAQRAARRDWLTPHVLEILSTADHGTAADTRVFAVSARAECGEEVSHWPTQARGFVTGLMVLAADEQDAADLTLAYLRTVEDHPGVRFAVESVQDKDMVGDEHATTAPPHPVEIVHRPRGVVGIAAGRAYFRA